MSQSVESIVKTMTQEQKDNIFKIYKKYSVISYIILGIVAIISFSLLAYFHNLQLQAPVLSDEHFFWSKYKFLPLVIGGVLGLIAELVLKLFYNKKYPYFSEKIYKYLKKQKKESGQ